MRKVFAAIAVVGFLAPAEAQELEPGDQGVVRDTMIVVVRNLDGVNNSVPTLLPYGAKCDVEPGTRAEVVAVRGDRALVRFVVEGRTTNRRCPNGTLALMGLGSVAEMATLFSERALVEEMLLVPTQ